MVQTTAFIFLQPVNLFNLPASLLTYLNKQDLSRYYYMYVPRKYLIVDSHRHTRMKESDSKVTPGFYYPV